MHRHTYVVLVPTQTGTESKSCTDVCMYAYCVLADSCSGWWWVGGHCCWNSTTGGRASVPERGRCVCRFEWLHCHIFFTVPMFLLLTGTSWSGGIYGLWFHIHTTCNRLVATFVRTVHPTLPHLPRHVHTHTHTHSHTHTHTLTHTCTPTHTHNTYVGSSDGAIKVWDCVKQYCTHNLHGSKGIVTLLRFHPSSSQLTLFSS